MQSRKTPRKLVCLAAAALAFLAVPVSAQAGPLVSTATDCAAQDLSQPFLPWADVANYTLQPGGDFEAGSAAWSVNGASKESGNEPFDVTDEADAHSLLIENGESATSPSLCVGIEHPDIRFFAKASSATATLKVEVLYEDATGTIQSLQIGLASGSTSWSPTAPYPLVVNLLPLLPGSHTAVAFRFTASGGAFRIDDVYVDPYSSR